MSQSDFGPDRGTPPGTPLWVKVIGIVAIVLVLLVGIILITGVGGDHGPGRHMPSGATGDTVLSGVTVDSPPSGAGPRGDTPSIKYGVQQP